MFEIFHPNRIVFYLLILLSNLVKTEKSAQKPAPLVLSISLSEIQPHSTPTLTFH